MMRWLAPVQDWLEASLAEADRLAEMYGYAATGADADFAGWMACHSAAKRRSHPLRRDNVATWEDLPRRFPKSTLGEASHMLMQIELVKPFDVTAARLGACAVVRVALSAVRPKLRLQRAVLQAVNLAEGYASGEVPAGDVAELRAEMAERARAVVVDEHGCDPDGALDWYRAACVVLERDEVLSPSLALSFTEAAWREKLGAPRRDTSTAQVNANAGVVLVIQSAAAAAIRKVVPAPPQEGGR